MLIRLRKTDASRLRVLVNTDQIISVEATDNGSSLVKLVNSVSYTVEESERTIRKLAGASDEE